MTVQLETRTALSAWASYLVNGDASGLEPDEEATILAWLDAEGLSRKTCATCEDAGFRWRHDASLFSLAGECQTYTFLAYGVE